MFLYIKICNFSKLLTLQMRPVFKEVATLLYRFTVPYKDLEHYRRYFATCRRVKLEKDPSIFCRFVLYILAFTYMALLNSGGYFFQQKVSPLAHIVLVDVVFVAESNDHAYLACIIVIAYTMILQWQLYFRCSRPFNAILERALFRPNSSKRLNFFPFCRTKSKKVPFQRLVLTVTNLMQLFVLLADALILIFLGLFCSKALSTVATWDDAALLYCKLCQSSSQ